MFCIGSWKIPEIRNATVASSGSVGPHSSWLPVTYYDFVIFILKQLQYTEFSLRQCIGAAFLPGRCNIRSVFDLLKHKSFFFVKIELLLALKRWFLMVSNQLMCSYGSLCSLMSGSLTSNDVIIYRLYVRFLIRLCLVMIVCTIT